MGLKPEQLVVKRGQLAKHFEGFAKLTKDEIALQISQAETLFLEEIQLEIEERIAKAIALFKEELRPKRRWFAPWRKP